VNVEHYWHHNKVKHEVKYSNFYDDSEFMYYYPLYKIMEEMNYQDDDLDITPARAKGLLSKREIELSLGN